MKTQDRTIRELFNKLYITIETDGGKTYIPRNMILDNENCNHTNTKYIEGSDGIFCPDCEEKIANNEKEYLICNRRKYHCFKTYIENKQTKCITCGLEFKQPEKQEIEIAEEILTRFYYDDWEIESDGQGSDVRVGDFVDLFFEAEMNGYHEWHIKGVIVLDQFSNYGKDLPILLLENGESMTPQLAWDSADISRIIPTKELVDKLVEECSFDHYQEFKTVNKLLEK